MNINKNKNKNKIKLFAAPYIAAKALPVLNTQITSSRLQSNFSTVKNTTAAAREKSSLALGRKLSKKESILLGAKKAWDTPNLPAYLLALHNNIFVRIFRILGGISIFLCFQSYHTGLFSKFFYVFASINVLFLIYNIYITYHKVRHTLKLLKGKELELRNSPRVAVNILATKFAKALLCVKGLCETTVTFGGLLSLGTFYDAILLSAGADPVFVPKISEIMFPNSAYAEGLKKN